MLIMLSTDDCDHAEENVIFTGVDPSRTFFTFMFTGNTTPKLYINDG